MPRLRTLKYEFFTNDTLADLPFSTRLLFAGLWCIADREGKLLDRPKRIKALLFPYDAVPVNRALTALAAAGFIERYEVDGERYIRVTTFNRHQNPHRDEARSRLPNPPTPSPNGTVPAPEEHCACTVLAPEKHSNSRAGSGEGGVGSGEGGVPLGQQEAMVAIDTSRVASRRGPARALDPDPDFTAWWAVYPRHDRAAAALKAYQQRRADGRTVAQLLIAAQHFRAKQDALGTPADKIPHALRFLGEQRDLEWEHGSPDADRIVRGPKRRRPVAVLPPSNGGGRYWAETWKDYQNLHAASTTESGRRPLTSEATS
jgi:hypothetical protein